MSQLGLALEAEISTRHLSFLEAGRTQPSREMVLLLARVLEVPLRGRNELLTAAGYAPVYRETGLDAPEMAQVKQALGFMLRQQEPFPAMVLDRHWNILLTNDAMGKVMGLFLDPAATAALGPANAMRLSYHPKALRPYIVNWESTAAAFIQWLHRDLLRTGDAETRRLLDELLSYPDVPKQWQLLDLDASTTPFLAIELRRATCASASSRFSRASARRTTSRCTSFGSTASSRPTRRPTQRFAASDACPAPLSAPRSASRSRVRFHRAPGCGLRCRCDPPRPD